MARSRRRIRATPPKHLILDSGAVIALARLDPRARAALAAAREAGVAVSVPAVVVAETVRGSARDAPVDRVIKAVGEITPIDAGVGRTAGELLGATWSDATIDALVVAAAVAAGGGSILTGDRGDLEALAGGHPEVVIRSL